MKPDKIILNRTAGDTYPIRVAMTYQSDAGMVAVQDDAIVKLHVKVAPTNVVTLTGTPQGGNRGVFLFAPGALLYVVGTFEINLEVHDGIYEFTIAKGHLVSGSQLK